MDFKDKCLAYLEGELSEQAQAAFQEELKESQEKQTLFDRYKQLMAMEQSLSQEQGAPGSHFTVKVMDALDGERSHANGFMERYFAMSNKYFVPAAGLAVVVICVALVVKQSPNNMQEFQVISSAKYGDSSSRIESVGKEKSEVAEGAMSSQTFAPQDEEQQKNALNEAPKQEWFGADDAKDKDAAVAVDKLDAQSAGELDVVANFSNNLDGASSAPALRDSRGPAAAPGEQVASRSQNYITTKKRLKEFAAKSKGYAERTGVVDEARRELSRETAKSNGSITINDLTGAKNQAASGKVMQQEMRVQQQQRPAKSRRLKVENRGGRVGGGGNNFGGGRGIRRDVLRDRWSNADVFKPEEKEMTPPASVGSMVVVPEPTMVPPQPPRSNESYGEYRENPRMLVSQEPRSTFSLDVDTGSYTNMRRFLGMGKFPPRNAVRVEEFINYFKYDYPSQVERPFAVHYEIAPSPFAAGRHLLKVGVKARDNAEAESSKAWNLVFLIDVSGSMSSSNKLPLLKQSMAVLVNKMRPEDRIAIVTYATGANVVLPSTTGSHKQQILNTIQRLRAGGSTNGSAGIDMAYEQAWRYKQNYAVNRVVLATDGDFNVGTTDFNGLMRLIEQKRRSGVGLTSLGFGKGNLKEKNLEQLANKGNGNYFYIDSFAEARKVLGDQLASTMEVVAKDVKLQVEFNPNQVLEYRLIGYDNRVMRNRDFANDAVDAGEIGSGHTVTALYEVVLTGSSLAGDISPELRYKKGERKPAPPADEFANELAFVKIRYKEPNGSTSSKMQFPIESRQLNASFRQASEDFRFASAVAAFGQLLRGSQYAGGYSYQEILQIAISSLGPDASGLRRQFVDLVRNAQAANPRDYRR